MGRILPAIVILFQGLAVLAAAVEPRAYEEKRGNVIKLLVQNPFPCPITVALKAELINMATTKPVPLTEIVPALGQTEMTKLQVMDPNQKWKYTWSTTWRLGDPKAHYNVVVAYRLPYPAGESHKVIQGFDGPFSHTGEYRYAIDWEMPVGSPVCATRDGIVVRVRADSDEGGADRARYESRANFIVVYHEDGTLGNYMHLKHGGVKVKPGQTVHAGEVIGLSGETGFTTTPHLHFHVELPVDGRAMQTVPIRFSNAKGEAEVLKEGKVYVAPKVN